MTKLFSGSVRALVLTAMLATSACSTTGMGPMAPIKAEAAKPLPPRASDPAAATFKWQPSRAIGFRVHNGFDSAGILRPDGPATYDEADGLAQIKQRCAARIVDMVDNVGAVQLSESLKSTGAQTFGSIVGAYLGIEAPTAGLVRQVGGLTAGTSFGGSVYSVNLQMRIILDSAWAQCTIETAKVERAKLGRLVVFQAPLLQLKAEQPMAPGEEAPVYDD